jgi:hypothetical protein
VGVVAFGLYCVAGSALVSHLIVNASGVDGLAPAPSDTVLSDLLSLDDTRSTAVVRASVVISIAVHEGTTHSSSVMCTTSPDRVSSEVIDIAVEDFPELCVNLDCKS